MKTKTFPARSVFYSYLPKYGFVTIEETSAGQIYIWNGHGRGPSGGRERAVICWTGSGSRAFAELDRLAAKARKLRRDPEAFRREFKVHLPNEFRLS